MRSPVAIIALLLAALALPARAVVADKQEHRYKVIVHPDSPITAVSRELLRNAYLKKTGRWPDGPPIRPVDLSRSYAVRERFTVEVLRKTPAQLRSYWNQQIFSGKGVPPPEARTTSDLIAYVLATPGAVGYLPIDVDPRGAKVVELD